MTAEELENFASDRTWGEDAYKGYLMAVEDIKNGTLKLAALSPAKQEQPKERFCGCRSGEDCNADCVVPAWIAKRVLAARDAHIKGDHDEVWHQLYSIAHPDFDTLSKDTWKDLEEMAKGAALPYTEEK